MYDGNIGDNSILTLLLQLDRACNFSPQDDAPVKSLKALRHFSRSFSSPYPHRFYVMLLFGLETLGFTHLHYLAAEENEPVPSSGGHRSTSLTALDSA